MFGSRKVENLDFVGEGFLMPNLFDENNFEHCSVNTFDRDSLYAAMAIRRYIEGFGDGRFRLSNESSRSGSVVPDRYERLISRRSIRLVLKVANVAKPLFLMKRRVSTRLRKEP